MKFQKILALCLANLTLFSTVAFANPPEISKYVEFGKYFINECKETKKVKDSEGENWVQNVDKRSDEFDEKNQEKYTNVLEEQKLRAEHQNKYHDCNCRFASAAIAEKLTKLGIENYELLVLLPTGKYHLANLYEYYNSTWVVADCFGSVNAGDYKFLPLKEYFWNVFTQGANATACFVKNRPLKTFKTTSEQGLINISLFANIYKKLLNDNSIEKLFIGTQLEKILGMQSDSIIERILNENSTYYKEGQPFKETIIKALKMSLILQQPDPSKKASDPTESLRTMLKQMNEDYNLNLNDDQIEQHISDYTNDNFFKFCLE